MQNYPVWLVSMKLRHLLVATQGATKCYKGKSESADRCKMKWTKERQTDRERVGFEGKELMQMETTFKGGERLR